MNDPTYTYQGLGFSGRPTGDVTLPRPIEQSSAEAEVAATQSADSDGVSNRGAAGTIAAVIGVALLLALTLVYVQGTFDSRLYGIGLNWESCGPGLSEAGVLCGDELVGGSNAAGESFKNGVESWLP